MTLYAKDITVQCLGTDIVKLISQCLHHTLIIAKNRQEETELPRQNHTDQFINLSD